MFLINILLVDDHTLFAKSLSVALDEYNEIEHFYSTQDIQGIGQMVCDKNIDIILMDIRMPGMDGVYCTKVVKEKYPHTKVIILTTFDDDDFVFRALKYGASGYLLKGVGMDELYKSILTVYKGGAMINPDIATKVFGMFSKMSQDNMSIQVEESSIKYISKPEWKVIQLVSFGLSNKEIAQKLFLSEGTVRNYLSSILSKLCLRDRTQLAIWAVQTGQTTRDFSDE